MRKGRGTLDDVDRRLIRLLQEDGRMATSELAKRVSASEPTVRKRLSRLLDDGAIRIRAVASPFDLGYGTSAFIGLDVDKPRIRAVAQIIAAYPFIDSVNIATGPHDIIVKASFRSIQELSEFVLTELGGVEGVKDSNSFLILEDFKNNGLVGVAGTSAGPAGDTNSSASAERD